MFKKIILFLIILALWFFSSVFFPYDAGFYQTLNIPKFAPSGTFIAIIWIVIYLLNTISIYNLVKNYKLNNDYYFILIINYLFNQAFPLFFFYYHSLFLSLVCTIVIAVTTPMLMIETKKINKKSAYLLIPYSIWSLIAFILSTAIFLTN
jgi:tryptophan-rich sensory protein